MRFTIATASALTLGLSTSLFAQTWSPRQGYATQTGLGVQVEFGSLREGRYQFIDGNFRNQTLVMGEVAVRAFRGAPGTEAEGRSWSRVLIDAGPASFDFVSSVYSRNYLAPPTRCFAGPASWPTQAVAPNNPLTTFSIKFPFSQAFVHAANGKRDFAIEFQMFGGKLASANPWAGRRSYMTDGYSVGPTRVGGFRTLHNPARPGCVDSNASWPGVPGRATVLLTRYGPTYSVPAWRGKLQITNAAINIGPSAAYLNIVDFAADPAGVPFGSGCENFHLKVSPAALYLAGRADPRGFVSNDLGLPNGLVEYSAAMRLLEPVSQFAWSDTRTNVLKLTSAATATVPQFLVVSAFDARRFCVFGPAELATGLVTIRPDINPVFRYN